MKQKIRKWMSGSNVGSDVCKDSRAASIKRIDALMDRIQQDTLFIEDFYRDYILSPQRRARHLELQEMVAKKSKLDKNRSNQIIALQCFEKSTYETYRDCQVATSQRRREEREREEARLQAQLERVSRQMLHAQSFDHALFRLCCLCFGVVTPSNLSVTRTEPTRDQRV